MRRKTLLKNNSLSLSFPYPHPEGQGLFKGYIMTNREIKENTLYLVAYERTHNHEGKAYKTKVYLVGYFDLKAVGETCGYFIGTTYGKITGRRLPYCDLTELDKDEFEYYCTIVKEIGEII